jgi:hypothetical protein
MARKGWNSLSPAYRARIEKAGLTQADYEAGTSLTRARGHANTPERPSSYNPTKYQKYNTERNKLIAKVEQRKQELFGDSARWSKGRSDRIIREKPPSLALMRWALEADDGEIIDAIREDPETFHFLCYH